MSIKLFGGARPLKRVSEKESIKKAIHKIAKVRKGDIKPLKTGWPRFNDAFLNGIEWRTITIIGARPGVGKTFFLEQLITEAIELNKDQEFRVLKFQLEMLDETDGVRKLSIKTKKSYETLMSKYEKVDEDVYWECVNYHDSIEGNGLVNVNYDPCTVNEFCATIHDECEAFKKIVVNEAGEEEVVYTNLLVTLDHSALLKKDKTQKDKFEVLNDLGEALTYMKKHYPVSFIILSQLNRSIESTDRGKPGTYGNYILDSDIYGSDALLQHADVVIGINRPADRRLSSYGPDKFIIKDEDMLVFHFIKSRNGTTRISFFRLDRNITRIVEAETPPRIERIDE